MDKHPRLILIAEDDALLGLSLADVLMDAGYRTKVVATADAALRYAESAKIDAALIDLHLRDGANGIKLAHTLAKRDVPVIVCSGHGDRYVRERLGPVPGIVLGKPVAASRLLETLRDAVAIPPTA